jgi:large-conductance mechanosensitive channel
MIDMSNGSDAASIGAALIDAFGAIISAIVAAIISVISLVITNKNNTKVEELRNKLAIEKDEEGACRDYEYEARKRLYQEFEPLLFYFLNILKVLSLEFTV